MMKMMSEKYVEQVLNIYNHVDTVILTDTNGYITYFVTYRPDVNPHRPKNMIGKHMLEAFPMLTEETGTGKELAAQSLHSLSIRRDNRFV